MNNLTLEAIEIKIERIEQKHPIDFKKNKEWIRLNTLRELVSIQLVKRELKRHKDRVQQMGVKDAKDSVVAIKQLENYLKRKCYLNKEGNNSVRF